MTLSAKRLLALAYTVSPAHETSGVNELDATATFHVAVLHDYDDRRSGIGCTADHYDEMT